jgi:hypothetical protein
MPETEARGPAPMPLSQQHLRMRTMDEKWVSEIHKKMEQKTTEELLEVWVQNDRGEWTDEAFEAVSRILGERGEPLPPQQESIDREKERLFQGILPETRVQLVAVLGAALLAAILFVFIEVIPRSIRSSEMEALFGSDYRLRCLPNWRAARDREDCSS